MAGSSEFDTLMSTVQRQIDQSASSHVEGSTLPGLTGIAKKRRTSDISKLSEHNLHTEISRMEKEVSDLEVQLDLQQKRSFGEEEDFIAWMRESDFAAKPLEEIEDEIERLEDLIDANQKLTGVQFNIATWILKQQNGTIATREHFLEGYSHGEPFQITFNLVEDFSVLTRGVEVVDLTLYVKDEMEEGIGEHLQLLTEDCNIVGFFSILVSWIQWHKEMNEVKCHFLKKYPQYIRSEQVGKTDYLVIENSKLNRPTFVIELGYKINGILYAEKELKLSVKIPQELTVNDKEKTLSSAPGMFEVLVARRGVHAALEAVVIMVQEPRHHED